jgi:hypothetical protein
MKVSPLVLILAVLGVIFFVAAVARVAVGAMLFLAAAGLFLLALGISTRGRKRTTESRR